MISLRSLFSPRTSPETNEGECAIAKFSVCGHNKLGIIAGGGNAPRQLIDACREKGRNVFVICLKGHADENVAEGFPCAWISLGEVGLLKQVIAEQQIKEIVMLGRVRRPSLAELKPDAFTLKLLTKIGFNMAGDDQLLTSIGKAIESETGVKIIGAHEVFSDILTPEGILTNASPDKAAWKDIERGREIAKQLGALDVGQAVIVQQGIVLGVEAVEGTDALIARSADLRREGPGGVLIKMSKPQQNRRVDLPTIGLETIDAAHAAGLRGIAVESGRSIFVERQKTLEKANELGLFIIGLKVKND